MQTLPQIYNYYGQNTGSTVAFTNSVDGVGSITNTLHWSGRMGCSAGGTAGERPGDHFRKRIHEPHVLERAHIHERGNSTVGAGKHDRSRHYSIAN